MKILIQPSAQSSPATVGQGGGLENWKALSLLLGGMGEAGLPLPLLHRAILVRTRRQKPATWEQ
jgi:hypothetical protein